MKNKEKYVIESVDNPFSDVVKESIDRDNFIIKNVCPFGTDKSANNRVYKDKAIESLTTLCEGSKVFLNHPSRTELKEMDGVRDVRDWAGMFTSPRRDGNKIFANLKVREAYWDLFEDIALMRPHGVGMSINARVKVFANDDGMESVEDVASLRSVDLVSSAATTQSLFEAALEKNTKEQLVVAPGSVRKIVEYLVPKDLSVAEKTIEAVTNDRDMLIKQIVKDNTMSIEEKKDEITRVFATLTDVVNEFIKTNKKIEEDEIMSDNKLTLEMLRKDHSDLVEAILDEYKKSKDVEKTKAQLTEANDKIKALEGTVGEKDTTIQERDNEIKALKTENDTLKTALDERELAEKAQRKRERIDKLVSEMPKECRSDVFTATLMRLEDTTEKDEEGNDAEVTIEEQAKKLIEDRVKLYKENTGKVRGAGDEFDESRFETKTERVSKEQRDKDVEEFVSNLK